MVSKNDVELRIEGIAFGGFGLGRINGKVWFVPFTLPKELIRARPIHIRRDFVEGELTEVVEASADRIPAPCPWFQSCGGCAYQHIAYEKQLEIKKLQVSETLRRIAKIEDVQIRNVIPSPKSFGYRNRITVHIRDGRVGFFSKFQPGKLIEIEQCLLAKESVNKELKTFRSKMKWNNGNRTIRDQTTDWVGGFRQVNDEVAEKLQSVLLKELSAGGDVLLDAYCGDGFLSRKAASYFREVIGIDWSKRSIAAAKQNSSPNCQWIESDVRIALPELKARLENRRLTLILDPPAEGMPKSFCKSLLEFDFQKIFYVSCNPATFARDIQTLSQKWSLQWVDIFDMFPQTGEIEVLGFLTNSSAKT